MSELWQLGVDEISSGLRKGRFSAVEVLESTIERADAMNPDLNAITVPLFDQAMEAASQADRVPVRQRGPLHGVPTTIKENVDQAGTANTNGVPANANLIAEIDAPLVSNLTNAGAIVIGRTNTPEFSMRATTVNPLRGRTYNPWDPDASAGGSSGGAGAACASGLGVVHHGNDIGGSLRFPAFANGVTTVKPTSWRVPVHNATAAAERGPLSQQMSVQGVLGRSVADVAAATASIIQPDARDPFCPPVPWHGPDLGSIKIAMTTESADYRLDPGIAALVRRAADLLSVAGYEVEEVDPPPIIDAAREWFRAGITEMRYTIDAPIRAHGSDDIQQIFDWYYAMGEILDVEGYITAFGDRTRLVRDWSVFQERYPIVLTPFLMRPLYDWDYDLQGFEAVKDLFDAAVYSTGINYLGLPAGVISLDLVAGRPAAVQLVGPKYREDLICAVMADLEALNGGPLVHRLWP